MNPAIRIVLAIMSLSLLQTGTVECEVFSASADLTSTFLLEQQIVNVLAELVAQTEVKLGIIRK